ncbi:hypothetical protein FQZ97_1024850 [compost metagenome]
MHHREGEQRKRDARVEQAHEEDGLGAAHEVAPDAGDQKGRQQEQRGQRHTQARRGQGAELGRAQAHEEKGRAPEGGEQDEFEDEGG